MLCHVQCNTVTRSVLFSWSYFLGQTIKTGLSCRCAKGCASVSPHLLFSPLLSSSLLFSSLLFSSLLFTTPYFAFFRCWRFFWGYLFSISRVLPFAICTNFHQKAYDWQIVKRHHQSPITNHQTLHQPIRHQAVIDPVTSPAINPAINPVIVGM